MHLLWDIRVVLDLFLGGIGIGAFVLASILYTIDYQKYKIENPDPEELLFPAIKQANFHQLSDRE